MKLMALAVCLALTAAPALAQQNDEIVVTGTRVSRYDNDFLPVIRQQIRADFMIAEVAVESDSRDDALRREEVIKTLQSMADKADRDARISLGVSRTIEAGDDEVEYVFPLTRSAINKNILARGARADTTRATIIVKTPIAASDTFDSAKARIEAFTASVAKTGRADILDDATPGLSIVDLGQYRAPLLKAIAADNAGVRTLFGDDYRVTVSGLEQPVRWRITGPLELAIYFPYQMSAAPK